MHKIELSTFSRPCAAPVSVRVCLSLPRTPFLPGHMLWEGPCVLQVQAHLRISPACFAHGTRCFQFKEETGSWRILKDPVILHEIPSQRLINTKRKITGNRSIYHFYPWRQSLSSLIFQFPASFSPYGLVT